MTMAAPHPLRETNLRGTNPRDINLRETWHLYDRAHFDASDLSARVHVWRARVDRLPKGVGDNLSSDELARANRFYRAEDRDRFVAARGVLRMILADCLDLRDEPRGHTVRFFYGQAGKPVLANDAGLHFNVSHADGLAAFAVTHTGAVGIDIERQRPMRDMDRIARFVFNDAEQAALLGSPPEARGTIFTRIWTRKEAILKAMGTGLSGLGDPNAASSTHAGDWFLMSLPHLDGYAAALARPCRAHGLKLWSWPNASDLRSKERRARHRPMPAASLTRPFGGRA